MSSAKGAAGTRRDVERVQTGLRLEKRVLKVLKALAEYEDMSLGDLVEGIVLHAFEGKAPFSKRTLRTIADMRKIYGLDLRAGESHKLSQVELPAGERHVPHRRES